MHPDPPKYKTQPTKVRQHACFIPGREERCKLDMIEPWELSFWDIIEIDFEDHSSKHLFLLGSDAASGRLHIKALKCKDKAGNKFDEMAVEEVLHQ